jgi:hypothetical protein
MRGGSSLGQAYHAYNTRNSSRLAEAAVSNSSARFFFILLLLAGGGYLYWMWSHSPGQGGFDVGQAAPEIAGKDIDGVGFKLSDYRGKVVVLDFWGNW